MTAHQSRLTRKIELVETHNMALSIRRIKESSGCARDNWRRALYRALSMSCVGWDELQKIRIALNLP